MKLLLVFLIISCCACTKDWTCRCKIGDGTVSNVITYNETPKETATKNCKNIQENGKITDKKVKCKLVVLK